MLLGAEGTTENNTVETSAFIAGETDNKLGE